MNSPGFEWALVAGGALTADFIRSRGEADGDTASECLRNVYARHPRGRQLWAASWLAFAVWFWRHIDKDL